MNFKGFGFFDEVEWPEGRDIDTLLRSKLDLASRVESSGCFDGFYVIERHLTRLSANVSQSVFLSALSQKTSKIRLGALVYVLPLRNPLMLAEEISLLDHIAKGRLDVGLGSGISDLELSYFGIEPRIARDMSKEATIFLLQYFDPSIAEINFEGKYYAYKGVKPLIRPLQRPHPPIWIPSRNKETMPWLGENSFNTAWIFDTYDTIKEAFDLYWKSWSKARNAAEEPKVGIVRHVYVSSSDQKAESDVKPYIIAHGKDERYLFREGDVTYSHGGGRRGYRAFDVFLFDRPDILLQKEIVIAGSPSTVTDKIKKAIEFTGANYFLPYFEFGDMSHDTALQSIELFCKEVAPNFVH